MEKNKVQADSEISINKYLFDQPQTAQEDLSQKRLQQNNMQLVKSPSKGGGLSKKGSKNNFNYFNGMKIKSSVPSTPMEKELQEELQAVK